MMYFILYIMYLYIILYVLTYFYFISLCFHDEYVHMYIYIWLKDMEIEYICVI